MVTNCGDVYLVNERVPLRLYRWTPDPIINNPPEIQMKVYSPIEQVEGVGWMVWFCTHQNDYMPIGFYNPAANRLIGFKYGWADLKIYHGLKCPHYIVDQKKLFGGTEKVYFRIVDVEGAMRLFGKIVDDLDENGMFHHLDQILWLFKETQGSGGRIERL
jgi:hypothetical protein